MNMPYIPSLQKQPFNPLNLIYILLALLVLLILFINLARAETLIDMPIIAQIESNNNPKAVSSEGAIGLYQITYVCLQDYNVMNDTKYTSQDLFKPEVNKEIAYWYMNFRIPQLLRHFHKPITLENCLISYNAGVGYVLNGKIPKETQNYIIKYHKLAK